MAVRLFVFQKGSSQEQILSFSQHQSLSMLNKGLLTKKR